MAHLILAPQVCLCLSFYLSDNQSMLNLTQIYDPSYVQRHLNDLIGHPESGWSGFSYLLSEPCPDQKALVIFSLSSLFPILHKELLRRKVDFEPLCSNGQLNLGRNVAAL